MIPKGLMDLKSEKFCEDQEYKSAKIQALTKSEEQTEKEFHKIGFLSTLPARYHIFN